MKNIMSKLMLVLFIVVLLVAALPFSALAENIDYLSDSDHQHHFIVENRVTCEPVSEEEHITTLYSIYTCTVCAKMFVDNESYHESHEYEGVYGEYYDLYSIREHLKVWFAYDICIWCGDVDIYTTDSCYEVHETEPYYYESWDPATNEYHLTKVNRDEICKWCGQTTGSGSVVASWHDWHEFDDSVDPEVDMDGVCIRCGDAVSW